MVKKHKLEFDYNHDYFLIGVNSILEDFLIAFRLNQTFNITLRRKKKSLNFGNKKGEFSVYDYENLKTFNFWSLITNKQVVEEKISKDSFSLFESLYNTYTLIPEKKQIDFFLKIEGEYSKKQIELIVQKIQKIDGVMLSYQLEPLQLKSKSNLIY